MKIVIKYWKLFAIAAGAISLLVGFVKNNITIYNWISPPIEKEILTLDHWEKYYLQVSDTSLLVYSVPAQFVEEDVGAMRKDCIPYAHRTHKDIRFMVCYRYAWHNFNANNFSEEAKSIEIIGINIDSSDNSVKRYSLYPEDQKVYYLNDGNELSPFIYHILGKRDDAENPFEYMCSNNDNSKINVKLLCSEVTERLKIVEYFDEFGNPIYLEDDKLIFELSKDKL